MKIELSEVVQAREAEVIWPRAFCTVAVSEIVSLTTKVSSAAKILAESVCGWLGGAGGGGAMGAVGLSVPLQEATVESRIKRDIFLSIIGPSGRAREENSDNTEYRYFGWDYKS